MKLLQTPLYKECQALGGRMVPFANWEMPVSFSGLIEEHNSVRQNVGMFDISHMGVLQLKGKNLKSALQNLVPSDLFRIGAGEACYTVFLKENGGIQDDLIIYDQGTLESKEESIIVVINAARKESDIQWLNSNLRNDKITISEFMPEGALIAIQGPQSIDALEHILKEPISNLPRFGHRIIPSTSHLNLINPEESIFVARTGYTGEEGFEFLSSPETARSIWKKLIHYGVTPCGLGARDTLRLEACMHLYGNDIDLNTTPFEAGLGWLVHLEMPNNFIGRKALEKQVKKGTSKKLVGIKIQDKGIARKGYSVLHNQETVGIVTSGTWSPTLKEPIALAYVPSEIAKVNTQIEVEIRGKIHPAIIVKRPFYKRSF
tara:strand:- start:107 stop:1231 length:1125 start_codon:yes stop_codon:yes gene_type:complete